jgi:pimeloyl-ACP methyl ester carboxylesterase
MDRFAARLGLSPGAGGIVHMHDAAVIEAVPDAHIPTLVVRGADDLPSYKAGTDYLVSHLPHAELCEVRGAGHDPHISHPDLVNAAVLGFLGTLET